MDPLISCLMPTYKRFPEACGLVNEAVGSFLAQNYTNAELIIINDCPEQTLQISHPKIRVINCPWRFATLGEKLNFAINEAQGEYICRFDDDDISLPWRLRFSLNMLRKCKKESWQSAEIWFMSGSRLSLSTTALYPAPSKALWTRTVLDAVRGFTEMNSGQDLDLEDKMQKLGFPVIRESIPAERIYYLYRWTSQSYHLSISGPSGYDVLGAMVSTPGQFSIQPADIQSYVKRTRQIANA